MVKFGCTLYQAIWVCPTCCHNRCEVQCKNFQSFRQEQHNHFCIKLYRPKTEPIRKIPPWVLKYLYVKIQQASLLFCLAKPPSGGIWGVSWVSVCMSEPFDSSRLPSDRLSWTHAVGLLQPKFPFQNEIGFALWKLIACLFFLSAYSFKNFDNGKSRLFVESCRSYGAYLQQGTGGQQHRSREELKQISRWWAFKRGQRIVEQESAVLLSDLRWRCEMFLLWARCQSTFRWTWSISVASVNHHDSATDLSWPKTLCCRFEWSKASRICIPNVKTAPLR